jgi:hypothetical protein
MQHNDLNLIGLIDLLIEQNENLTLAEIKRQQEIQRKVAKQNIALGAGTVLGSMAFGMGARINKDGMTMVNPLSHSSVAKAPVDAVSPISYLRNKFTDSGLTSGKNLLQDRKIFTNSQGKNVYNDSLDKLKDHNIISTGKRLAHSDPAIKGIETSYDEKVEALKKAGASSEKLAELDKQHATDLLAASPKVGQTAKTIFGDDPNRFLNTSTLASGMTFGLGMAGANYLLRKGLQKYQQKKYGIAPPVDNRHAGQKIADTGRFVRNMAINKTASLAAGGGVMAGTGLLASSSIPVASGLAASALATPVLLPTLAAGAGVYASLKISKHLAQSRQKLEAKRRIQLQINNINQDKTMDPVEKSRSVQQLRQQLKDI